VPTSPRTRTSTVRRSVAAVAVTGIALTGLTACKSATTTTKGAGAVEAVGNQVTTPAATGDVASFTWNLPDGEPSSLDPIKDYNYSENTVLANICQGLLIEKPDLSLAPGLASSYANPSPTRWVYTLRSGVKFSDGKPLTAEDVVYSLERNRDAKLGSYWSSPFYDNVTSIKATDATHVQVDLKQPDPLFNRMMSTAAGAISEKAYVEKLGGKYGTAQGGNMCTGPYSLAKWTSGASLVLKKNPYYWDTAHAPKAATITFDFLTDESTIVSGLQSGEIDGTFRTPTSGISALSGSSAGKLYYGATTEWFAFRYTAKKGPLADPKIREALSLAVDRNAIAKVAFGGAGTAALTPIQPASWGYGAAQFKAAAQEIGAPKQDLAKAKSLVQEAGSPKQQIAIAVSGDTESEVASAEAVMAAGKQIGLNMKMHSLSASAFNTLFFDAKARAPYDLFAAAEYGAGVADPIVSLSEFTPLSVYDYSNYDNPDVTNSVRDAFKTTDDTKRAELVAKAEVALVKDNGILNLVNPANVTFINKRLTGAPVSIAYLYYPWAADLGASGQ